MSTETEARRTKRRYAHELYPHAEEGEIRSLVVDVPYWYSRMVGLELMGTNWSSVEPRSLGGARVQDFISAARIALLADALAQGITGDEAWAWATERVTDDMECAYDRAVHYGVPLRAIKPYPCGGEPDRHDHLGNPDARGMQIVTRIDGPESDCDECTEGSL